MTALKKPLVAALLAIASILLFGACVGPRSDSTIPWARPATWENQIPGMGTGPGGY